MVRFILWHLRATIRLLRSAARCLRWSALTVWDGAGVLRRLIRIGRCIPDVGRELLPCPRGHSVPVFGVFQCRCGAIHEGWAFGRCKVCGQSAGWTPCPECGLPVINPLRR
jgi:hypothetical protein